MITLLRKIRKKLLTGSDLSKYLVYAIGEIMLVMIGILLALQVNTWNDERNQKREEIAALNDLREEFQKNKEIFLSHLDFKRPYEEAWHQFLVDIKNEISPFHDGLTDRPGSGAQTLNITFGSLNAILSTGKIDRIRNDSLKYLLTAWEENMEEYVEDEKAHWEFLRNEFQSYESEIRHFPWIGQMVKGEEEQYIFSDKEQIKTNWIKTLQDTKYQNLMIMQHWHLVNVLAEGESLLDHFTQIIDLLNEELTHN